MSITINNVGFSADSKLKDFIEAKLNKLSRYYNRITNSTVYLKLENSGQVKDKIVEVTVSVPGKVLVSKAEDKSFESAVDECANSLERQLKKYKGKF
ncbi:MAG: ribosome-associated translation inhibitor RaiA [Saprospiraceae bacterium]|nr:ribosome-associated translation inhibitor RaiA [Saprospiraceae bacterium]